jgi:hypothetical protein
VSLCPKVIDSKITKINEENKNTIVTLSVSLEIHIIKLPYASAKGVNKNNEKNRDNPRSSPNPISKVFIKPMRWIDRSLTHPNNVDNKPEVIQINPKISIGSNLLPSIENILTIPVPISNCNIPTPEKRFRKRESKNL